ALARKPADRPRDVESWLGELAPAGTVAPLAPPLQRWLDRWQGVKAFYALSAGITAMLVGATGTAEQATLMPAWWVLLHFLRDALLMLALPMIAHCIVKFGLLRNLLRAGYRAGDLRLAKARRRNESQHQEDHQPSFVARINRDLLVMSLLVYLGSTILARVITHDFVIVLPNPYPTPLHPHLFTLVHDPRLWNMFAVFAKWSIVTFWSSVGLAFILPPFRLASDGWWTRLRARVRPAVPPILYWLAAIGLRRGVAAEHTLHRPTELVLDLAIDDLWTALPDTMRHGLRELPAVADSLRDRVGEMKELTRQLEAPSLVNAPDAVALRERLTARQQIGITALEQLRLQLMRLSGETAPTGALTAQLRDALALDGELLTELGGHPSLKRLLKRKPTTPGITPTPALPS
ncbi:MAG: hypothetical protein ACRELE_00665, partial [Gemmatimonadales bacterium]